ncbi:MAG: hypothetical protein IPG53_11915 [Ignavibacteriales bacterium]|nr:hypothetical protein [Ignavibacteriales bacterium]
MKQIAEVRKELLDSEEISFISVLERVNSNRVFTEFNEDLRAMESEPERWFQVIMIYLQFRLKIREGIQGDNAIRFWYFVKDVLMIMPKETITALYLQDNDLESMSLFLFSVCEQYSKSKPSEIPPRNFPSRQEYTACKKLLERFFQNI